MISKLCRIRVTSTTDQHRRLVRDQVQERAAGCNPDLPVSSTRGKSPGFPDEI